MKLPPLWLIGIVLGGTTVAVVAAASSPKPPPPPPQNPGTGGSTGGGAKPFLPGGRMISPMANPNAPYEGASTAPSTTNLATLMDITHPFTVGEVQYLLRLWAVVQPLPSSPFRPVPPDAATVATIRAMRYDGSWDDSVTKAVRAFQLKGMGYQGANIVQGDPFDGQTSAALHAVARSFAGVGF